MFEISADQIALLNDEALRAVVARLCEAEVRRLGYSPSAVTWGGSQTAPDGGIDVRVALAPGSPIHGFVPRAAVGLQVKRQDMPRAEILKEMRPSGTLRQSIQELAAEDGAYIIVSSQGSTSDTALESRRQAMREALTGAPEADRLAVDFYDANRIATWLRTHVGLIPWVRELIAQAIPGWRGYGAWAYVTAVPTSDYLFDEQLRIQSSASSSSSSLSALDGIRRIREELSNERRVVRLVGLSGVGKTRLAQALFDCAVGEANLNPDLAIYANLADGPEPQPIALASDLIAAGERAILVIDNCSSELHHRLSELCRGAGSLVSLLTIEYDIRDDVPEGTDVYKLEGSSPALIDRLVEQWYPSLSQVDRHTIAEFSGGNARIALALASTIGRQETVAGLTDGQLFQRLFLQRHAPDEDLYMAAQACSLVYSFQGDDVSSDGELWRLGLLIGMRSQELYRNVAELRRRDLIQQRGIWRAVLPHAIANRLAAIALQNVPFSVIEQHLLRTERLLKSFSRRIGYLDGSKEAVAIVKGWLSQGGMLENLAGLNDLGKAIVKNIAPAAPTEILSALERTILCPDLSDGARYLKDHVETLRSLAYDPTLFERCATLMSRALTLEEINERAHEVDLFASLFQLYLSGTHATVEQRLGIINQLLDSPGEPSRRLGILSLDAALEAWHFQSNASFDFGARSRDFGYWPRTKQEVQHWFRQTLSTAAQHACTDTPAGAQLRSSLASRFRTLWIKAGVQDELVALFIGIRDRHFWPEGWIAVRETMGLDGGTCDPDELARLSALETGLRPRDLEQKIRAVAFTPRWHALDLDDFTDQSADDITTRMRRLEQLVEDLGASAAADEAVLREVLPESVRGDGHLWEFGRGLCKGTPDPSMLWAKLVGALAATEPDARKPQVLRGFLHGLRERTPHLVAKLLDEAFDHETLAYYYPLLQTAVVLERDDVSRLKRSMTLGKAPAAMFVHLSYGANGVPAADLRDLILTVAGMDDGYAAAAEILEVRLIGYDQGKQPVPDEIVDTGRSLLRRYPFNRANHRDDHRLATIAKFCLTGTAGADVVREVCCNLKSAVRQHHTNPFYHEWLLGALLSVQPTAALDELCSGSKDEIERGVRILRGAGTRGNPLHAVSEGDLLQWCDADPTVRYPAMARLVRITVPVPAGESIRWSAMALKFLAKAPDPSEVLKGFVGQFTPAAWGGSLAAILESHVALLDQLSGFPILRSCVAEQRENLADTIDSYRKMEFSFDRDRDERFE